MARFKGSIVMEAAGNGWSEHYYLNATDETDATALFTGLAGRRMKLSPPIVKVKAVKLHDLAIPRSVVRITPAAPFVQGTFAPGGDVHTINLVADALLVELSSGPARRNRIFMRGLPDAIFADGIFVGDVDWALAYGTADPLTFGAYIKNGQFLTRTKDPAGPGFVFFPIVSTSFIGVTTRKPGRPFGLRPGRRTTPTAP